MKGCKKKEGVPIVCDQCKMNFCLRHRHAIDHSCKGNNPVDRARYIFFQNFEFETVEKKTNIFF